MVSDCIAPERSSSSELKVGERLVRFDEGVPGRCEWATRDQGSSEVAVRSRVGSVCGDPMMKKMSGGSGHFASDGYAGRDGGRRGDESEERLGRSSLNGHIDASSCEYSMMKAEKKMLKLIPFFDSDMSGPDEARDFWRTFETATTGMSDSIRLMMFGQRVLGVNVERWCLDSQQLTFEALKQRFYNRFIRLTHEQLLQRVLDAAQNNTELVDDWGMRVLRYCEEALLFDEKIRFRVFKNGLHNKQTFRFLDCVRVHSVEVVCEWIVAKEFHRPERRGRSGGWHARQASCLGGLIDEQHGSCLREISPEFLYREAEPDVIEERFDTETRYEEPDSSKQCSGYGGGEEPFIEEEDDEEVFWDAREYINDAVG